MIRLMIGCERIQQQNLDSAHARHAEIEQNQHRKAVLGLVRHRHAAGKVVHSQFAVFHVGRRVGYAHLFHGALHDENIIRLVLDMKNQIAFVHGHAGSSIQKVLP